MPAKLFSVLIAVCSVFPALAAPADRLYADPAPVDAETSTTVVTLPAQARYAIFPEGDRGCSLSVHDRMYGPLGGASIPRSPTEPATRFEAFLEAGDYQIRLAKGRGSKGTPVVQRFSELPPVAPPAPGEFTQTSLADLQTLSVPLRVSARHPRLEFFALGRSLGGMALFSAGNWDTGIKCRTGTVEILKGHPLTWCEYAEDLPPGEYTVVLWGAQPLPGESGGPTPDALSLVQGKIRLDEIGVFHSKLGSSGLACWSIPGSVTEVEATATTDSVLKVIASDEGRSRLDGDDSASTDIKGAYRTASLDLSASSKNRWITVSGPAGAEFDLRLLPKIDQGRVGVGLSKPEGGTELVRLLGAVSGEDAAPITAWIYRQDRIDEPPSFLAERSLTLSSSQPIHLTGNLLERQGFLVRVESDSDWVVLEKDSVTCSAEWKITPLSGFGLDLKAAHVMVPGKSVRLASGLYLLSIKPVKPGIFDALVAESGLKTKFGGGSLWKTPPLASGNALSWPPLSIPSTSSSVRLGLALGERGGVPLGFSRRNLPALLSEQSLSLFLGAKQVLEIPVKLDSPATLRALGPLSPLAVDGKPWSASEIYAAGEHRISFSGGERDSWLSIEAVPVVTRGQSEALLTFEEGKASWNEFTRGEVKHFLLSVRESSLYSVSTTGRLATTIAIRSPLRLDLFNDSGSGPGRNSQVSAWLRPGRYLVEVGVTGKSAGWAGVTLEKRPIRELSALRDGKTLRATVDAGEAVSIPFSIDRGGNWALEAIGLGRSFSFRLEDADGWPVFGPIDTGSPVLQLLPGPYRYISLPELVPTRRVFSLAFVPEEKPSGEQALLKEFPLSLGRPLDRTWKGSGSDAGLIDLPVPLEASFSLDPSMSFRLVDASGQVLAAGIGGDVSSLSLPEGKSRLELQPLIPDEDHGYTVAIDSPALFEGRKLPVSAGTVLPLITTRAGSWEIETTGVNEFEFALFRCDGSSSRLVATGSRISDDWNTRIRTTLGVGTYLVKVGTAADPTLIAPPAPGTVSPGESDSGSLISLRYRSEQSSGSVDLPFTAHFELTAADASFEFTTQREGAVLLSASSILPVELRLERDGRTIASARDALRVVLSKGGHYRLVAGLEGEGSRSLEVSGLFIESVDSSIGQDGSFDASKPAAHLADKGGPSRLASSADLLVAPSLDSAFTAASAPFLADGAWIIRADLKPIGQGSLSPLTFSGDGAGTFPLPPGGQRAALEVAPDTVSLVRLSSPGAEVSITDRPSPIPVAWNAVSVRRGSTLLALSAGSHLLTLRDSASEEVAREALFNCEQCAVANRLSLEAAREAASLSVDSGTALAIPLDGRVALCLSLGKGLAAFVADGTGTVRTFEADTGSASFSLVSPDGKPLSGTLYIVNPRAHAAVLASLSESASSSVNPPVPVTGTASCEVQIPASGVAEFRVDGKDGEILMASGTIRSARFYDEDSGAVSAGRPVGTPAGMAFSGADVASRLLSFGGKRGILRLELNAGWYRVFLARPEDIAAGLLGPELARTTVTLDAEHPLLLARQASPGLLAVLGEDGRLLAFEAAASSEAILVPLAPGRYTVAGRAFAGNAPAKALFTRAVRAESVEAGSPPVPRLLAPGELEAFRFSTAAPSRVGASVRADSDAVSCRLYSPDMKLLAEGPLIYRELERGSYYFVVESLSAAVRYEPVILGLGEK